MPLIFRGMFADEADSTHPKVANAPNCLGVRDDDVHVQDGRVYPTTPEGKPQGVSTARGGGCNLPVHRRPKPKDAQWRGTGPLALRIWAIDTAHLGPDLVDVLSEPPPDHVVLAVASPDGMTLAQYRDAVAHTRDHWHRVDPPVGGCPQGGAGGAVADDTEAALRSSLAGALAGDDGVDPLVTALRAANAAGTGRDAIVELLSDAAMAADDDDPDGAERLRTVLDRITGFCRWDLRIDLD